jgi:hypothetical protein
MSRDNDQTAQEELNNESNAISNMRIEDDFVRLISKVHYERKEQLAL